MRTRQGCVSQTVGINTQTPISRGQRRWCCSCLDERLVRIVVGGKARLDMMDWSLVCLRACGDSRYHALLYYTLVSLALAYILVHFVLSIDLVKFTRVCCRCGVPVLLLLSFFFVFCVFFLAVFLTSRPIEESKTSKKSGCLGTRGVFF